MTRGKVINKFTEYVWLFLTIHFVFFSYVVLKGYPYTENFNFIRKYYDTIDFGRSFSPEIDLIILFIVMGVYLLGFQRTVVGYLSIRPLLKVVTWIFIFFFLMLIYMSEYLRQPFFYSLQLSMPLFTFTEYIAFALTVVIIAPVSEELIFRGPLLFWFRNKSKYLFIIISMFWFVVIHGDVIFGALFSLGLSFLTLRFKNLSVPIIAHAIWNFYIMHNQ